MMPVTIDCRAKEVVFHARPGFRPPAADRAASSPLFVRRELKAPSPFSLANPRAGAPSVPITINGQTTDAVLDTGSGSSIVLMPRLVAQRPDWVRGDRAIARAAGAGGAAGLAGLGLVGANVESVDALGVRFTNIDMRAGGPRRPAARAVFRPPWHPPALSPAAHVRLRERESLGRGEITALARATLWVE
jgi:hypothetical protein